MSRTAIAIVAGIAGFAGLCLTASADTPRSPVQVYQAVCSNCHGNGGAPLIRGRKLPAASVAETVRDGRNAMPGFGKAEISPAELDALARWIETSSRDPAERPG